VTDEDVLVRKFKAYFKDKKLREISEVTGLNISRVFRILNGSKISYFEGAMISKIVEQSNEPGFSTVGNLSNKEKLKLNLNKLIRLERIIGLEEFSK